MVKIMFDIMVIGVVYLFAFNQGIKWSDHKWQEALNDMKKQMLENMSEEIKENDSNNS